MSTFIHDYLEYTLPYESPGSFWKWSSYVAIAAVMRDNCYRMFGDIPIYPNIYVLLLAQSAEHRKGHPVITCERLVDHVNNTKVISGRASIQAVLDELARGETNSKDGRIISGGSALLAAPELSAALVSDPEAIKILTDIYDFKAKFTSRLRGTGSFHIKNVCFTMIGASNEDLLKDVYDTRAVFGGLLGRTFLIKPNEFRPANSLFRVNHTDHLSGLYEQLIQISTLKGQFLFTESAEQEYNKWYEPFRYSYRDKPDKSGVSGRIHAGVLKIAMILCANYTMELMIEKQHIEEAIADCMSIIPNYKDFTLSSGKGTLKDIGAIVLTALYNGDAYSLSRKKLLEQHWHDFDSDNLDKVISTFAQAGMVLTSAVGDELFYKLTDKCLETLFGGIKTEEKK